jgi:methylglutaconyl-CoA hydratase
MKTYQTIEFQIEEQIAYLYFNRPDVRNAFNDQMIQELHELLDSVSQNRNLHALVIRGNGKVFSAGADLNWMKNQVNYTYEENVQDAQFMYELFDKLYQLSVPTISIVHGASIGGANGILAASDIVLAETQTQFRFSEVKLGLVPATITPFVINRTGKSAAKYYMLTGKIFKVGDALRIGLIDSVGSLESLETELDILIKEILKNSSDAVKETKELLNNIEDNMLKGMAAEYAVDMIARARISEDGQEGMKAFLEKRKPSWLTTKSVK